MLSVTKRTNNDANTSDQLNLIQCAYLFCLLALIIRSEQVMIVIPRCDCYAQWSKLIGNCASNVINTFTIVIFLFIAGVSLV